MTAKEKFTPASPRVLDLERGVLGCTILESEAVLPQLREAGIEAADFYEGTHRVIFRAICQLDKGPDPLDINLLINHLKDKRTLTKAGGRLYILDLLDKAPTTALVAGYARQIKEKSIRRQLIEDGERIAGLGRDERTDFNEVTAKVRSITTSMMPTVKPLGNVPQGLWADELLKTDLPDPTWIIPGILPAGLTLLTGKPKKKKSFLCLHLGVAVAVGGRALGEFNVEKNQALYLALEDPMRRLKDRLPKLVGEGKTIPEQSLRLERWWPRVGEGAIPQVQQWIETYPDTKLVMIDTLARIKPSSNTRESAYDLDYNALAGLQSLAGDLNIAILVVHHLRKTTSDEPLDLISGTMGLTAAADTIWILRQGKMRADGELYITGRDVEERDMALEWDNSMTQWNYKGKAEDYRRSSQHQAIIEALREIEKSGPVSPKMISEITEIPIGSVYVLLNRMVSAGDIERKGRGNYICKDVKE